jgi:hypothetical protein
MVPSFTTKGYFFPVASKCRKADPLPPVPSQCCKENLFDRQSSLRCILRYQSQFYAIKPKIKDPKTKNNMWSILDLLTGLPDPMCPVERLSQRFSLTPVSSHFHCKTYGRTVQLQFRQLESNKSDLIQNNISQQTNRCWPVSFP